MLHLLWLSIGTNYKERGNHDIAHRRDMAHFARDAGSFSYSKNELNASSNSFVAIKSFIENNHTLQCVSNLTGLDLIEVTDMFGEYSVHLGIFLYAKIIFSAIISLDRPRFS